MIITLTNQLDNSIDINWDNVELQQTCGLNEEGDFIKPATASIDHRLAVRIHFVSGKSLIVQECLSDIREKIDMAKASLTDKLRDLLLC